MCYESFSFNITICLRFTLFGVYTLEGYIIFQCNGDWVCLYMGNGKCNVVSVCVLRLCPFAYTIGGACTFIYMWRVECPFANPLLVSQRIRTVIAKRRWKYKKNIKPPRISRAKWGGDVLLHLLPAGIQLLCALCNAIFALSIIGHP